MEQRNSVFDDAGGGMGSRIEKEDIVSIRSEEEGGKADIEGLKSLLAAKALMTEETFHKINVLESLTPESSHETISNAVKQVSAVYNKEQEELALAEMEVLKKLSMCAAFTMYCCLCTVFTSCCIGPYFATEYAKELAELTNADNFTAKLNEEYAKIV